MFFVFAAFPCFGNLKGADRKVSVCGRRLPASEGQVSEGSGRSGPGRRCGGLGDKKKEKGGAGPAQGVNMQMVTRE